MEAIGVPHEKSLFLNDKLLMWGNMKQFIVAY
jgi:hypothetical protein